MLLYCFVLSLLSVLECWERRSWIKCINIIIFSTQDKCVMVCTASCPGQDWCPSMSPQSLWFLCWEGYTIQTGHSRTCISWQSGSFNCHTQSVLLCVCVCVWQTDWRSGNDRGENLSWSCLGTVENVSVTLSPDSSHSITPHHTHKHASARADKHTAPWWTLAAVCAITLPQLGFSFFLSHSQKYRSSIRVSGHFHAANKVLSGVTASIFHLCFWDGSDRRERQS